MLVAGLTALAWYHFPAWVPRRLPRWRLPRLQAAPLAATPGGPAGRRPDRCHPARRPRTGDDALPAGPGRSLADRLAAEGRYAEAVRERLRDMVRRPGRPSAWSPPARA